VGRTHDAAFARRECAGKHAIHDTAAAQGLGGVQDELVALLAADDSGHAGNITSSMERDRVLRAANLKLDRIV
jgi:hypothetical protein